MRAGPEEGEVATVRERWWWLERDCRRRGQGSRTVVGGGWLGRHLRIGTRFARRRKHQEPWRDLTESIVSDVGR